jgi:hypothetical protein
MRYFTDARVGIRQIEKSGCFPDRQRTRRVTTLLGQCGTWNHDLSNFWEIFKNFAREIPNNKDETKKTMKTITKPIYPLLTVFTLACFALSTTARGAIPEPSKPGEATDMQVSETYGKLPLSFEANAGQTDPKVKFLSRGSGYSLFLTDS